MRNPSLLFTSGYCTNARFHNTPPTSDWAIRMIYAYNDPPSVATVALATGATEIKEIINAAAYDSSSRVRSPYLGEIVVWQNTAGYYLATKIEAISARALTDSSDSLTVEYRIAPNKSSSFAQ